MSTKQHDATLTVYRCDFPHCYAEQEQYYSEGDCRESRGGGWPNGWKQVPLSEGPDAPLFHLCPEHAKLRDVALLTRAVHERMTQQVVA